ncbi:siphovirus Gp157 family protein [Weissella confusa]|uniref:siphovirus Gp157 family protein n=1 Tax=Weissella confusa TaxID=1583 RepID=UPI00223B9BF8|nr:siphovirus Gp157 family protein [Weissella confusa]MCS9997129.1 siphovirus Gp157 family protein [Weissella confusa]
MNLYDLTGKYKRLYELDIDDEVFNDTIESLDDALEEKLTGYAYVIRNLEADEVALKEEERRLNDKRKAVATKIENIKGRVEQAMFELGLDSAPAGTMKFKFNKSNKVVIDDEENIPDDFVKVKTERAIDKKAIKAAIKMGVTIDGARVVESKTLGLK